MKNSLLNVIQGKTDAHIPFKDGLPDNAPHRLLRAAVTGRIERGEAEPIVCIPVPSAPDALAILKRIQAIPANEPGRIVMLMPEINALVRRMEGCK